MHRAGRELGPVIAMSPGRWPAVGQVWIFGPWARFGRGRVLITDPPESIDDPVGFTYVSTGKSGHSLTLPDFWTIYRFAADALDPADRARLTLLEAVPS